MIVNFEYSLNIGSLNTINSSIYFKLNEDEYENMVDVYYDNQYPLFINECPELIDIEEEVKEAIYSENAAIYLANKDFVNSIIDDHLGIKDIDEEEIIDAYKEIFNCDISFPKLVVKKFDIFNH